MSEVSEPKWASGQTTICEGPTDPVGSHLHIAQAWGQDVSFVGSFPFPIATRHHTFK